MTVTTYNKTELPGFETNPPGAAGKGGWMENSSPTTTTTTSNQQSESNFRKSDRTRNE